MAKEILYIHSIAEDGPKTENQNPVLAIMTIKSSVALGRVSLSHQHRYTKIGRFQLSCEVYQMHPDLPIEEAWDLMKQSQKWVPNRPLSHQKAEYLASLAFQLLGLYLLPTSRQHLPDRT